ncbi:hypothetical protein PVK06_039946 [Gossypium arboreum]|uniref:Uncharacterized protein n=1 Tax=Gossypium arboreum TaxID=29729 RepID=A0ABR0N479_GOSAR|nr:hypothetical protein PVK06_039946 [Gossypium arboreum]
MFWYSRGVKSVELAFSPTIQLRELRTIIKRKVGGLTWGRILKLQCRFLTSIDPYRYELFDVTGEVRLDISSHYSSKNDVKELYVKFAEADGFDPSSTIVMQIWEPKLK